MSFLVDTDICSAYLKGNARIGHRFIQHGGRVHLSVITAAELTVWMLRSHVSAIRRESVLRLLRGMNLLDVDPRVATKFGEVRASQLDLGLSSPDLDLLIGATALVHDLTLVTHNVQDFAAIPDLRIDDWLAP